MTTDLTGLIPFGWSGGEAVTKWWRGKYIHLYRLRKACAQCGKEITLDVTKAAITGTAKNAGLHLVRCPECRAKTPRDITSRPSVRDDAPLEGMVDDIEPIENSEVVALKTQNEMFLKSVQELQRQLDELKRRHDAVLYENSVMKAKLAQYELPTALQAAKPVEGGFPLPENKTFPWLVKNSS